jgi:hypothetical protein
MTPEFTEDFRVVLNSTPGWSFALERIKKEFIAMGAENKALTEIIELLTEQNAKLLSHMEDRDKTLVAQGDLIERLSKRPTVMVFPDISPKDKE